MKVACRWPGGMTLALPRKSGNHVTIRVNGPDGEPSVLPPATTDAPSRTVAHEMHKRVVDTVRRMHETVADAYEPHEYGVTDIPGDFWNEWLKANASLAVVTSDMVFALE